MLNKCWSSFVVLRVGCKSSYLCDLGTYGDFSIEYDNNNNKSNFDLKQATNALLLYILSFTVCTP